MKSTFLSLYTAKHKGSTPHLIEGIKFAINRLLQQALVQSRFLGTVCNGRSANCEATTTMVRPRTQADDAGPVNELQTAATSPASTRSSAESSLISYHVLLTNATFFFLVRFLSHVKPEYQSATNVTAGRVGMLILRRMSPASVRTAGSEGATTDIIHSVRAALRKISANAARLHSFSAPSPFLGAH